MVKIGELRHRVMLQRKTIVTDALLQQTEVWEDVATVWAAVDQLSGREYAAARQTASEATVKVTVRYRPDVAADMRVLYGNRIFEVSWIADPKEQHKTLILYCSEVTI